MTLSEEFNSRCGRNRAPDTVIALAHFLLQRLCGATAIYVWFGRAHVRYESIVDCFADSGEIDMPAKFHGGLAGKERHVRSRSRAARMYTQQWLSEYMEPEEELERPKRPIPIRWGRAGFASAGETQSRLQFEPTTFFSSTFSSDLPAGHEPEAAPLLISAGENTVAAEDEVLEDQVCKSSANEFALSATPSVQRTIASTSEKRGGNFASKSVRKDREVAGFIVGCFVGSAIAAVLLIALRFAFVSS